tara:strand:+ start:315 stop:2144 length:1830 start_codon:yes stop_codon:yes gene_type:complete
MCPASPNQPEQDDAIIGIAFKNSLIVLGIIIFFVSIVIAIKSIYSEETKEIITKKNIEKATSLIAKKSSFPNISFAEEGLKRGINFIHESGAIGDKYLPETMGSGVAIFDFEEDGDQDLLFTNGHPWNGVNSKKETSAYLYINNGLGNFSKHLDSKNLNTNSYGQGIAIGDYNGDGKQDIFFANLGTDRLYKNTGDGFIEIKNSGAEGPINGWSTSAGFIDIDLDGDLDLWTTSYVKWSMDKDKELAFTLNGTDRAYGPPKQYEGTHNRLYLNENGKFIDISKEAGLIVKNEATGAPVGKGLAILFHDFDQDQFPDVLVANDTTRNFLFKNNQDTTFNEIGRLSGIAFDSNGKATGAMGIDAGWFRNDHSLGIGIGNFANEMTSLYVSQNDPLVFNDEATSEGIGSPSRLQLSFGLVFFDYDLDGRLDMFQTNGHLEEEINQIERSQHYRQPSQLFWNSGPEQASCFQYVPIGSTGDLSLPIVGRGASYGDLDNDGDLDLVVTQTGDRPLIFINNQAMNHNWLRIRVKNKNSKNQFCQGSVVELRKGESIQRRTISSTRSYLSQTELTVTFGLGKDNSLPLITIFHPGKEPIYYQTKSLNKEITIDLDN